MTNRFERLGSLRFLRCNFSSPSVLDCNLSSRSTSLLAYGFMHDRSTSFRTGQDMPPIERLR